MIISSLTIDDNINITDNEITTTASNSDLKITPAGTGQVQIAKANIDAGTIDGTSIGQTTAAAGTFTTLTVTSALTLEGITIEDNTVKTNSSNANLELSGRLHSVQMCRCIVLLEVTSALTSSLERLTQSCVA